MAKKKITIHKKNELNRGSDGYSINAKRALNAIYYGIQKNNLFEHQKFIIRFSTLRELMNLEKDNRYVETIKSALQELRDPFDLNNFIHPETNVKYTWYSLSFLNEAGFRKDEHHNWVVEVEPNRTILQLMQIQGNFTELNLVQYLNKFRTKYAMKLYEYLKSFERYKYIDITDAHMRKLLNIEDIKTYKNFSDLARLVERQIKEIQTKSDLKELEHEAYKTTQSFKFLINKNASDNTPEKSKINNTLKSLINRF